MVVGFESLLSSQQPSHALCFSASSNDLAESRHRLSQHIEAKVTQEMNDFFVISK